MVRLYSIEGNIGSGKSTLIQYLKEYFKNRTDVVFIDEPVHLWHTIKDNNDKTILSHFYEDSGKWGFSFQIMAYISRLAEIRKKIKTNPSAIFISERCLLTDRYVFAKMLYDDKKIHTIDYQIYLKWFDEFLEDISMAGYIYLRTSPQKCLERVIKRNREGETIPIEYLEKCHKYHMDYIDLLEKQNNSVLELNGNEEKSEEMLCYLAQNIENYCSLNKTNDIYLSLFEKGHIVGC
mgnify:CR=1 FL=1